MRRRRVLSIPITLSVYVGRRFLLAVLGMQVGLTAIGSLFDFLDLLRQASDKPQASFGRVLVMEILRVPWLGMQILPFAVLLGGIFAFWRLTRSSELVVARASGVSAWQFLAMPVVCAALIGAITTTMVSPLSAAMFARAETLYSMYLQVGSGPLSLAGGQLWLRQADPATGVGGVAILHAQDVHLKGKELTTGHVTVLRLDQHTRLNDRIEAQSGVLRPGGWTLDHVAVLQPDAEPRALPSLRFPTDLTVGRVQESFASPSALSFWALPRFINLLERSGFSPTRHELAFQSLLSLPLLCATMALVAAGFSMRPARRGGAAQMLGAGLVCGFALFMLSDVAEQFGKSGALPVILAAWAPAAAGLMLALALLLHLEDG
ncbi:MAG: LPS export ABC transporter permease LptG [Acidiphilium sp. 37-64-53]|uniref:LPS export ABC transporter permease LptG n=1 Tax=Acidiphilium TaxID=522 RepID=UPI000BC7BAC9|nr:MULTISPECIES: LPS export ABC transporter permease LptG [Acidiphilium]OYW00881.1 MAG: LPS export ABC transporter permease LptG [Acidiphilium sp. 37-64-53]OZB27449.1 MAG: LPS export ABC transporter permease LptG [Acidiphilium sp. 34-64-41]HQT86320.1 LPS export ABC transporter permease LptG [Acidiphilium rubrum]